MTVGPISGTLLEESSHAVAVGRHGRAIPWADLAGRVAGLSAELGRQSGQRWALVAPDVLDFACGLLGAWAAGKVPVLVPGEDSLARWRDALDIDGVIGGPALPGLPCVELKMQAGCWTGPLRIAPDAPFTIFTSGSSGAPKQVEKTLRHIQSEVEVLESAWGKLLGVGPVQGTVAPYHMYGLIFRVLWPLAAKRPFARSTLEYPESVAAAAASGGALVTSPAMLKRISAVELDGPVTWPVIFSSGGHLDAGIARRTQTLLGAMPIEVLGSTETGAVAYRQQSDEHDGLRWRRMGEVRVRRDDKGWLSVSSPFVGGDGWLRMGDLVEMEADGSFTLLGRGDRIAKVEDKRISLCEVEAALLLDPMVAECAVVPLEINSRQYLGAVIVPSAATAERIGKIGEPGVKRAIRDGLRGRVEAVAIPRRLRFVEDIPVDSQGKRAQQLLRARLGDTGA